MGGYLRSTRLLPGMHVSRGEVIAVVEDQALVQLQQGLPRLPASGWALPKKNTSGKSSSMKTR